MFARQQAAALMTVKDDLAGEGVTLVGIGTGTPEQARRFVENFDFSGEMYVDPERKTYDAFDLESGFFKTLGPASISRGLTVMKQGFHQGRSAGALWQQGGLFVIGPGNQILFAHRDPKAGFHADPDEVVGVCRLSNNPE
jgi:peroxiredoxin